VPANRGAALRRTLLWPPTLGWTSSPTDLVSCESDYH